MFDRLRTVRGRYLLFALGGLLAGVVLAVGSAQVVRATDSQEFCSSCHVMSAAHGTFSSSNHAALECNDCHAPTHGVVDKMAFKARAGVGHVYKNTLGADEIPDVLHATSASAEVVDTNCIGCHGPSLENVDHDAKERCVDCHRHVPHGRGLHKDGWHEPMQVEAAR